MADLPTIVTKAGMQPQSPVDIQQELLTDLADIKPDATANLPGLLIEDISSTDVAAIVLCDSARVELVNSLTPYGANEWLLNQLGQVYGVPVAELTNTSVLVIFNGPPGYVIPVGFTVTDGVYDYVARDGGIIAASGQSSSLTFIAVQSGSWDVPAGTVTEIMTSLPVGVNMTCSNPQAGIAGLTQETAAVYRTRVLQAGLAAGQGMPSYVKTLLGNVAGVQQRLIAIQSVGAGMWKLLVGGGDSYEVAYAIYRAALDLGSLAESKMSITGITNNPNAVVTTALNHGYVNGETVYASGVEGMTGINGLPLTVTVINEKQFSTGINSSLLGTYTSGGFLTPNHRNVRVAVRDYPDVYAIPYVSPPRQTVAVTVTWNTLNQNYVNDAAVAQFGAPALADYINSVVVGQPMNAYQMECIFASAIGNVLPRELLSTLVIDVSINGVGTAPSPGTGLIFGDPESYFWTALDASLITVERGS